MAKEEKRMGALALVVKVAAVTLPGALIWFALIVFEEFVTADLRWVIWAGGTLLFVIGAWTARRGHAAWAPLVLTAPTLLLWGRTAIQQIPWLWPIVPLWVGAALAGWWLGRSRSSRALVAAAAVAVGMVLFASWFIPRRLSGDANVYVHEPAPALVLQQLDGEPYDTGEFAGKIVVLDFFSTWCLPCRAELPEIEEVRQTLAGRDDVLIFIVGDGDGGDTLEQIAAFSEGEGLDLPFLYDPEGKAHDTLGFWNVPALAVIDREHNLRLKRVGFNAAETGFQRDLLGLIESL